MEKTMIYVLSLFVIIFILLYWLDPKYENYEPYLPEKGEVIRHIIFYNNPTNRKERNYIYVDIPR